MTILLESTDQSDSYPQITDIGDSALMVVLGEGVSPLTNSVVHTMVREIQELGWPGIREVVPVYSSFVVHYDPLILSPSALTTLIRNIHGSVSSENTAADRRVILPTIYGGDFGPDLHSVGELTGCSVDEIVNIHSGTDYLVYALGFSPGFPYLGDLDQRLHCPRLDSPRVEVPAGSVAIAETQTGVYPVPSPGGWRLIGRTPVSLFDPLQDAPALLKPGDRLRFMPIESEDEYREIENKCNTGEYEAEVIYL